MENYDHKKIERKWQERWEESGLYKIKGDKKKSKYYILDMFPYPSGAGLHVGHPKGYIATDVFARMKMMQGYNVLHPMGWDAFGLPTENYAIENKVHPRVATEKNINVFKNQLLQLGFTYDWSREINTTDPNYYKWTQWIFLQMFKKGLAYESYEPINWCPSCQTGLANEDLENGKCERCGSEIERKPMRQWVLKITDYADRLLNDLEKLPDWEESIKEMQRNWIGRSEGAIVRFSVIASGAKQSRLGRKNEIAASSRQGGTPRNDNGVLEVFTTRPDTLFGCTYMVVAPEHPLIFDLRFSPASPSEAGRAISNFQKVKEYVEQAKKKSDLERTELQKEKTGVELGGLRAVNPVNGEEIPIFVADYVMMNYGTGAIMAVPAHDYRDWEFAKKYGLEIREVVKRDVADSTGSSRRRSAPPQDDNRVAYCGEGVNINSGFLDGLETKEAKEKITKWLEKNKVGKRAINYKLKDWVFSRQRYWGEPIPLIFCEECKKIIENSKIQETIIKQIPNSKSQIPNKSPGLAKRSGAGKIQNPKSKIQNYEFDLGEVLNPGWITDGDLPLKLPEVKHYEPTGTGESPLANIPQWVNIKCPKCGGPGKRETNTMPQWAGSSWYWLRYIDPENNKALVDKKKEKYWSPVDFYVGGAEHATRHLIYARFWHKFLYDIGIVNYPEPFTRLQHVGLILAEDGRKMSKRWGNVINPDEIVEKYGADSMRVYEMFMGPFSQPCAWSTNGLIGARKFLEKVIKLKPKTKNLRPRRIRLWRKKPKMDNGLENLFHKTIKKVGEDIEEFKLNTAVSAMMILVNKMEEAEEINLSAYESLLKLLAPFAPHLAEEIWSELGNHHHSHRHSGTGGTSGTSGAGGTSKESIFKEKWPEYDKNLIKDEIITLVVQVNGKRRDTISVVAEISEEEAKEKVLASEKVKKWVEGKKIVKVIFVRGRLINIVVK